MRSPDLSPHAAPVLGVAGLTKRFRGRAALAEATFEVPRGSLTVLLGPAGAGKTTTLRLIAGLERPDAGTILLDGREAGLSEPKDRNVAMIFDNLALYPHKTGFENIANPLRLRGAGAGDLARRVEDMAATLRIAHVLHRLPKTMSGGERQRVALGRALVRDPTLFLLDEPLSSLDAMLRIELRAELKRLQREFGASFLYATPDFAEALAVADTVVVLRQGKVVQIADPQALYDDPDDVETARFVGAPEINIVPARIERGENPRLHLAGGTLPLASPLDRLAIEDDVFDAGIRPEHVSLTAQETAPIQAVIDDIEPLGLKAAITARNEAGSLRLMTDATQAGGLKIGERVGLEIAGARILAFDTSSGRRIRR
jgi:ABC-type sugar transport system ATPase subunit